MEASRIGARLVLADGTAFDGWSFGATGTTTGEVVFNTGMTGYQEVITDPSYCGQIVTFTYPELGNTGINPEDIESSRPQVQGVIAHNVARRPSSWRATQSLSEWLAQHGIVGIAGIDTRALTRRLRSQGAMNGAISTELTSEQLLARLREQPAMQGLDLVPEVTAAAPYTWEDPSGSGWLATDAPTIERPLRVVAIDFGIKHNILRRLTSYGCEVTVVPATASADAILAYQPDGIFLSNGPGDPAAVHYGIETVQQLLAAQKPMFGICLGHQILALALGGRTYKLKFGHRGLNQPARANDRVEITSQNHGFAVDADSLAGADIEITHVNLNDRTVEGFRHRTLPVFSVQYHPEASPGPHDADYLFAQFAQLMREKQEVEA
ncbi:glutamine-hydrolyzing carbamoyl-phosphate synthase small subunit [Gloeobacter kilaueensis]|uniref:Carbamoyl phosphate synthase small chain n=1 Tax=Gloeobacter kilaueensis (strain ATCC BAA-2537 / CCAP 1431/1 / ULC 316 / JS1) TaxID=1183438 RepID=U5QKT4_GLOK1|nr:glutamine-hydrolyzing carbamoyl-phosphate synthase small subunit [Gloeobacter kilaueensis]AGY59531.1 carbamoyl phosphate synthase small subunit [Gloeobacter kilaueensis JS1]